jgi:hypothetical protein
MESIIWPLWQNALTVAALLPAVWLLCLALRHRPAAQHVLWTLLLVKLLLPPLVHWPVSIGDVWARSAPADVAMGSKSFVPPVFDSLPDDAAQEEVVSADLPYPEKACARPT